MSQGRPVVITVGEEQRTVVIHEDYKLDELGATLWGSAIVLCAAISDPGNFTAGWFVGKRVLDLGAGTGIMGLALAALGAREVVLTDNEPRLLKIMQKNISLNSASGRVMARTHDWCKDALPLRPPFDIIVACDCIYEGGDGLVSTLQSCCAAEGIVLLAYEPRGQVWGESPFHQDLLQKFE
ncbi:hypothetical protein CYMTET_38685, partial [Cymbomonas tetramitiformis]